MEDNKYFYEAEYKASNYRIQSLESQLKSAQEENQKQALLLEELYKLVYYKNAWLALSDENIRGMQEVIGRLPEIREQVGKLPWEEAEDEPWGV